MKKLLIKFLRWALRKLVPTSVYLDTKETLPLVIRKSKVVPIDQINILHFWKSILIYDLAVMLHEHCYYEVEKEKDWLGKEGRRVVLNITIMPKGFTKLYVNKAKDDNASSHNI